MLVEDQHGELQLKLVDFGSSVKAPETIPGHNFLSLDLEFAAPELLSNPPNAAPSADMWSAAVFLYAFLR